MAGMIFACFVVTWLLLIAVYREVEQVAEDVRYFSISSVPRDPEPPDWT